MSTPPKATRFRTRKVVAPSPADPAGGPMPFAPAPEDDGFGDIHLDSAAPAHTPDETAELAAIEAEGLTARQLRLARRVALKQGISARTDQEAVMLLRRQGVDPFQRSNLVNLMLSQSRALTVKDEAGKVPAPSDAGRPHPPATVSDEARRAHAIIQMQRDIVRRRRRNFALLMVRLAFFVFLPTLMASLYYYRYATPLFATQSEFLIQQSDPAGAVGLGAIFRGTQLATSQDAIAVQAFLESRDAMLRLDQSEGYKAHFSQASIDPIERLAAGASNEAAYRLYRRNVKVSYDPTEGIIKMEVIAADPQSSERFAKALIRFAEQQVDQMSQRVREDQMKGARESYADAENKAVDAQRKVQDLQEKLGVLDPKSETTIVMTEISSLQTEMRKKQLERDQLLDNPKPNQARLQGVSGDIDRLQKQIADLRTQLTDGTTGSESLAAVTGELRIAEAELRTRQQMMAQALQQLETTRIEANRQVRYLSQGVSPIAPDEATYPKAFEDTALAFLIFAGIYMMLSLTASILREQVTS